jgi:hypothetical protein
MAASAATPTPFQPDGRVVNPFLARSDAAAVAIRPTFTPNPTPYIAHFMLPTPVGLPSSEDASVAGLSPPNNPLTGLPASDPLRLDRRPMAVKVTNYPRYVRPQSGLTLADVVFEYYIEDELTRFIAIMYGNDSPRLGPVRSGRYFDEHVARMYQAYYVFKYADPREFRYFKESDLQDDLIVPGNGACPPFVVGESRRDTYNNIFFNTTRFATCLARSGLENTRPALRSSFYSDQPVNGIASGRRVYTRYSAEDYNYWEYVPEAQNYVRYQEQADTRRGKPESYARLTDAQTGRPVTAENVVMLFVRHTFANQFEEEDEVYHIDLVESGRAIIFRDGAALSGYWYRTEVDQPLVLATALGTPIYLRPGATFFQVIGSTSSYVEEGGEWHFQFRTP